MNTPDAQAGNQASVQTAQAKPARAARAAMPKVKHIKTGDVLIALRRGLRDFQKAPACGLAFGLAFAAAGWGLIYLLLTLKINYYVYPMATGFAMLLPFVAAGLYEVSHRLEQGKPVSWGAVLGSARTGGGKDLLWMVVVTTFAYIIWLDIAVALYVIFYGLKPLSFLALVNTIMTTPSGMLFFVVGNLAGAILGGIVFSLTVVSLPLLFDHHVDFVTAMITSVKVVLANPKPMLVWAAIIGILLGISLISVFVALIVVLPVLGHATWHIYRATVEVQVADAGSVAKPETGQK